jgi:Growth inhibitor
MTQIKQGDIIYADLSPTNGHEQRGRRPLLVLSNDIVRDYSNVVTVAPISSTIRRLPLYKELPHGLITSGVVLLDQIRTIDFNARNASKTEEVPDDYLEEVLDVARRIFTK